MVRLKKRTQRYQSDDEDGYEPSQKRAREEDSDSEEQPRLSSSVEGAGRIKKIVYKNWITFRTFELDLSSQLTLLHGGNGAGKCLARGTKVLMASGQFQCAEDIQAGDTIMGAEGTPKRVLTVTRGREEMARVETEVGAFTCNMSHVISFMMSGAGPTLTKGDCDYRVEFVFISRDDSNEVTSVRARSVAFTDVDAAETFKATLEQHDAVHENCSVLYDGTILDMPVRRFLDDECMHPNLRERAFMFHAPRIELFDTSALPAYAPPAVVEDVTDTPSFEWTLGAWLGAGSVGHEGVPQLTTTDPDVVEGFTLAVKSVACRLVPAGEADTNNILGADGLDSPFLTWLRANDLCSTKHVPPAIKVGTVQQRLSLLAGFVDTSGRLDGGAFVITHAQGQLSDDIKFIARSLGLSLKVSGADATARFMIHGALPCRVHKTDMATHDDKNPTPVGFTVTPQPEDDYYGFTMEGPTCRFIVTESMLVTHNSSISRGISFALGGTEAQIADDSNKSTSTAGLAGFFNRQARADGEKSGHVSMHIVNTGYNAYCHGQYGDTLVLHRDLRLNASGTCSTSFSLNGTKVSAKTVRALREHLNLDPGNQLQFINQNLMKTVANIDPYTLYSFFLQATRLEHVRRSIEATADNMRNTVGCLDTFTRSVERMQEEYVALQHEVDSMQGSDELHARIKRHVAQLTFIGLRDQRAEVERAQRAVVDAASAKADLEQRVATTATDVEKASSSIAKFERKLARLAEESREAAEQVSAAESLVLDQERVIDETHRDIMDAQAKKEAAKHTINTLSRDLKRKERDLEDASKEVPQPDSLKRDQTHSLLAQKAVELENTRHALDKQESARERMREDFLAQKKVAEKSLAAADAAQARLRKVRHKGGSNLNDINERLQLLADPKIVNRFKVVEACWEKIVPRLKDEDRPYKPVAPVAAYLVVKPAFARSKLVRQLLQMTKVDAVCFNRTVFNALNNMLMRQKAGISLNSYPSNKPPSSCRSDDLPLNGVVGFQATLLDALEVKDAAITCYLIDFVAADRTLLFETEEHAKHFIRRVQTDKNESRAVLKRTIAAFPGGTYRIEAGGILRNPLANVGFPDIPGDLRTQEQIEKSAKDLEEAKDAATRDRDRLRELEAKMHDQIGFIESTQATMAELAAENSMLKQQLAEEEEKLAAAKEAYDQYKKGERRQALQDEIAVLIGKNDEAEDALVDAKGALKLLDERLAECKDELKRRRADCARVQGAVAQVEETVRAFRDEREQWIRTQRSLQNRLATVQQELARVDSNVGTAQATVGIKQGKYQAMCTKAARDHPDTPMGVDPGDDQPPDIAKKIAELEARISEITAEHGRPYELVLKEMHAKHAMLEHNRAEQARFGRRYEHLEQENHSNRTRMDNLRLTLSRVFVHGFNEVLTNCSFQPNLKIHHPTESTKGRIDISVGVSAGVQALEPKQLSGGQKSLLADALFVTGWKSVEVPFVTVDEWDVFLDETSRQTVLKYLVESISSAGLQALLVSPKKCDLTNLGLSADSIANVRIIELEVDVGH
ncbi:Structural maintenance chromosome protein 6 Smc6 [Carpediemonas membranifera]|uniref:Structural maintenance chromosome protein 6 Smc6 n=1 Tax=Carpediemonas membranifera TaxID=201153 RepID=A0A8J6AWA9_9EUKA|nr:Structural maintenance chromosome protein 6 Smc6 [Carpediemonas membranifera]|eukprot:KAG9389853.1 Structural maintenance chromosome protein 6 Smc6 [Carpediemonas membranifera]